MQEPLVRGVKKGGNTGAFPTQYELIRVVAVCSQPRLAWPTSTTPSFTPSLGKEVSNWRKNARVTSWIPAANSSVR